MNSLILAAMVDELVKLAFNEAAASRVLSLAKKLQLPKASKAIYPIPAGSPSFKRTMGDAQSAGRLAGIPPEEIAAAVGGAPGMGIAKRKGKTIFPGGTGHMSGLLRSRWTEAKAMERGAGPEYTGKLTGQLGPEPAHLPAKHQKMLHAVVKGHELDEASVQGALGAVQLGHRSPDVIFREHNRIMTLPQEHQPIRDFMKAVRQKHEGDWLFPKGLAYGESPRLSRHARRRLTESAKRKTLDEWRKNQELTKAFEAGV